VNLLCNWSSKAWQGKVYVRSNKIDQAPFFLLHRSMMQADHLPMNNVLDYQVIANFFC